MAGQKTGIERDFPRLRFLILRSAHLQGNILALAVDPCTNERIILGRRLGLRVSGPHLIDSRYATKSVGTGTPRRLGAQR